jgi:predicted Zn-ribbon and HTH transcriptional regulator
MRTEREKISDMLEYSLDGLTPTEISVKMSDEESSLSTKQVIEHIEHIRKSLKENDNKDLLALPPKCLDCGYSNFDNLVNIPTQCPESDCYSKRIAEPKFIIKQK